MKNWFPAEDTPTSGRNLSDGKNDIWHPKPEDRTREKKCKNSYLSDFRAGLGFMAGGRDAAGRV